MTVSTESILESLPSATTDDLNIMLATIKLELKKRELSNYVNYVPDFCTDATLLSGLQKECESLGIKSGRKVASQFLSTTSDPYIFPDTNPVHKAIDIKQYPFICELMTDINNSDAIDGPLDSCLVLKYSGSSSSLSLHSDDEKSIDQEKSICSFSIGSSRTIEFCDKASKPKIVAEHNMAEGGLLIMKPGTQSCLQHMVRAEIGSSQDSHQVRYSLSFRALSKTDVVYPNAINSTPTSPNAINTPTYDSYSSLKPCQRVIIIA